MKLVLVLIGLAWLVYLATLHQSRGATKLYALGGVAVLAPLWYLSESISNKGRRAKILEALGTLGINSSDESRYLHPPTKGQKNFALTLAAKGEVNGRPVSIVEFTFDTGSGSHTVTHYRMQVWRECPERWPTLLIQKRPGIGSRPISQLFRAPRAGLELAAFEKRWQVTCDDKDFMVLALTPQVQEWLAAAPKNEEWLIGEGIACVSRHGKCQPQDIPGLIDRLDQFMSMLPAELESW